MKRAVNYGVLSTAPQISGKACCLLHIMSSTGQVRSNPKCTLAGYVGLSEISCTTTWFCFVRCIAYPPYYDTFFCENTRIVALYPKHSCIVQAILHRPQRWPTRACMMLSVPLLQQLVLCACATLENASSFGIRHVLSCIHCVRVGFGKLRSKSTCPGCYRRRMQPRMLHLQQQWK